MKPRPSYKRAAALLLLLTLLTCLTILPAEGEITQAQARNQVERVFLTRLNLSDRLDITLLSPYGIWEGDENLLRVDAGAELAFLLRENAIYLYYENLSLRLGGDITLRRYENGGAATGFSVTNFPALYEGDLRLTIVEGALRPILSLHVEDYLKGVVPYEMSDSFPLEALKAQAVAARTYALRAQSPQDDYDLVDTTNDQVFRGYIAGYDVAEQAIAETRGVCGFYNGNLAQCYYSASNGGQTERVETVWPTDEDFGYYAFGSDPYDVANPASPVRSYTLKKSYGEDEQAPYSLRRLLAEQLADTLASLGCDTSAESVRVDGFEAVSVHTPSGDEGSILMTKLQLTVNLSARSLSDVSITIVDPDDEEVSLFLVADEATPTPAVTQAPDATPEPQYGPFTPLESSVTLVLNIFPTAEAAFTMNLLANYDNEIWSVVETDEAFEVQARRYGHGVGMSQRGAQWMAAAHQMGYEEILAFYYPGMALMRYPEQPMGLAVADDALGSAPGPAPTPTPRPTVMPVTLEAGEGQWFATVTEIDDDSSLNLRAEPSLSSDVKMRLYKNQRLLILERCEQEGWVHVKTDTAEGYVMEAYLTPEDAQ